MISFVSFVWSAKKLLSFFGIDNLKASNSKIIERQLRREKFKSVQRALESRENELIKLSRREDLNRKINSRTQVKK